jgi:hypothetical protein
MALFHEPLKKILIQYIELLADFFDNRLERSLTRFLKKQARHERSVRIEKRVPNERTGPDYCQPYWWKCLTKPPCMTVP